MGPEELKDEQYPRGRDDDPEGYSQQLRIRRFTTPQGVRMVVEEYLAVKDLDCDGKNQVSIAVYAEGERPPLDTKVFNLA